MVYLTCINERGKKYESLVHQAILELLRRSDRSEESLDSEVVCAVLRQASRRVVIVNNVSMRFHLKAYRSVTQERCDLIPVLVSISEDLVKGGGAHSFEYEIRFTSYQELFDAASGS